MVDSSASPFAEPRLPTWERHRLATPRQSFLSPPWLWLRHLLYTFVFRWAYQRTAVASVLVHQQPGHSGSASHGIACIEIRGLEGNLLSQHPAGCPPRSNFSLYTKSFRSINPGSNERQFLKRYPVDSSASPFAEPHLPTRERHFAPQPGRRVTARQTRGHLPSPIRVHCFLSRICSSPGIGLATPYLLQASVPLEGERHGAPLSRRDGMSGGREDEVHQPDTAQCFDPEA